jgi:hypothetical protein
MNSYEELKHEQEECHVNVVKVMGQRDETTDGRTGGGLLGFMEGCKFDNRMLINPLQNKLYPEYWKDLSLNMSPSP